VAERRVPDPTLMARLQLSVKGVDWACSLLEHRAYERVGGEWSAHQNVFHLLTTERAIYHARIGRIVAEDNPVLVAWDNAGDMLVNYVEGGASLLELASEFMAAREHTVELLRALQPEQWFRTGTWPDGRTIDLAWLAEKALWHSLDHFAGLLDLHGEMEPLQAPAWAK
jgi:DinB superfamily